MTLECRPSDQLIETEGIESRNQLFERLWSDPTARIASFLSTGDPLVLDLSLIESSSAEGQCVGSFVSALPDRLQGELRQIEDDLRLANTNNDLFVTKDEILAFVQGPLNAVPEGRTPWRSAAEFRIAAASYLNLLPGYTSQPDLTDPEISRLWGILNDYARRWDASFEKMPEGEVQPANRPFSEAEVQFVWDRLNRFAQEFHSPTSAEQRDRIFGLPLEGFPSEDPTHPPDLIVRMKENRLTQRELAAVNFLMSGSVYNLSLSQFPSRDQDNPPDLIQRAMPNQLDPDAKSLNPLNPEELAAIHALLQIPNDPQGFLDLTDAFAPLAPEDIGFLQLLLEKAAEDGVSFFGMRILTGEEERALFASQQEAGSACRQGLKDARGQQALTSAFRACSQTLGPLEDQAAGVVSASSIVMMANLGLLGPNETSALKGWMREEAARQKVPGGPGKWASDFLDGAGSTFRHMITWEFAARTGSFVGGALLYRRFVVRGLFERALTRLCGGPAANPAQAYRDYQGFIRQQLRQQGFWRALPRRLLSNPYLEFLAFNYLVAPAKDTGNLPVDISTDMLVLPAFYAFEHSDNFSSRLGDFVGQNRGICRPQTPLRVPAPEPVTVEVPEPAPAPRSAPLRITVPEPPPILIPVPLPTPWYEGAWRFVGDNAEGIGWGILGVAAAVATVALVVDDGTGIGVADDPLLAVTGPGTAAAFTRAGLAFARAW